MPAGTDRWLPVVAAFSIALLLGLSVPDSLRLFWIVSLLVALASIALPQVGLFFLLFLALNTWVVEQWLGNVLTFQGSLFYTAMGALVFVATVRVLLKQGHLVVAKTEVFPALALLTVPALYAAVGYGPNARIHLLQFGLPIVWYLVFRVVVRHPRDGIKVFVFLVVSYLVFAAALLPNMVTGMDLYGGYLRGGSLPNVHIFQQATAVAWLFNLAATLMFGVFLHTRRLMRFASGLAGAVFASASLLTFSRGAVVGLIVGVAALMVLGNRGRAGGRWVGFFLAIGLVMVIYLSPVWDYTMVYKGLGSEVAMEDSRLHLALRGLEEIMSSPLWGSGVVGSPAHSLVLDTAIQYGVPYAAAFFAIFFLFFRRSWELASRVGQFRPGLVRGILTGCCASFVVMIIQSIFDPTLNVMTYGLVFWTLRGIESIFWRQLGFGSLAEHEPSGAFEESAPRKFGLAPAHPGGST